MFISATLAGSGITTDFISRRGFVAVYTVTDILKALIVAIWDPAIAFILGIIW
jgi:hypothetical protein